MHKIFGGFYSLSMLQSRVEEGKKVSELWN